MSMAPGLSSSGARIRGDDYQHLAGWIQVVEALLRGSHVERVGIEDPGQPGADDVTVYRSSLPDLFLQAKSAVDARQTASVVWLSEPSRKGGPSILQKFHGVWSACDPNARPRLMLLTNRSADPNDPVMPLRDGRDWTVAARLTQASRGSAAGKARQALATHLSVPETELIEFLRCLQLVLGRSFDDLMAEAGLRMYTAGMRRDEDAVRKGIAMVHDWVTSGERRVRTIAELRAEVSALGLSDHEASGLLVLQVLDRSPLANASAVSVDWVDHFVGDEPRVRRELTDPTLWNTRLRGDLKNAAQRLRSEGHRAVLVDGFARLPTWFATGIELCETASFDVVSLQRGVPWASSGHVTPFALSVVNEERLSGTGDIAVAVSISREISPDVLPYVRSAIPSVSTYLSVVPAGGAGNQAIADDSEARGCARAIRDHVRELARSHPSARVHCFLCCPRGIALLLGHLWDRMPTTQLYEDLSTRGYLPSYLIPN